MPIMSKQLLKNIVKFATFGFVFGVNKNVGRIARLLLFSDLLFNALHFPVRVLLLFGFHSRSERPRYEIKNR